MYFKQNYLRDNAHLSKFSTVYLFENGGHHNVTKTLFFLIANFNQLIINKYSLIHTTDSSVVCLSYLLLNLPLQISHVHLTPIQLK